MDAPHSILRESTQKKISGEGGKFKNSNFPPSPLIFYVLPTFSQDPVTLSHKLHKSRQTLIFTQNNGPKVLAIASYRLVSKKGLDAEQYFTKFFKEFPFLCFSIQIL